MRNSITNSIWIMTVVCIVLQSLIIESVPLPVVLPFTQFIYMRDPYWQGDAREANAMINHFIEPLDTVSYKDYRYVGSHNAFTDPNYFKIARQQDKTILAQLSYGVRGLMLDTYDWNQGWPFVLIGPLGTNVCLSHDSPGFVALIQKGTNQYQSLKSELRRVVEFMKVNPQAVITVILENYANGTITVQEIKEIMIEANYDVLFKPADLVANQWPTLGWMRSNNKRLVIFMQRGGNTEVAFSEFNYSTENQYSTTDQAELCKQRAESHGAGPFVVFNNFNGIGITPPVLMTRVQAHYDTAKRVTTNCQAKNFAGGRMFNGYWIDRIIDSCDSIYQDRQKTIFEYVNELNPH